MKKNAYHDNANYKQIKYFHNKSLKIANAINTIARILHNITSAFLSVFFFMRPSKNIGVTNQSISDNMMYITILIDIMGREPFSPPKLDKYYLTKPFRYISLTALWISEYSSPSFCFLTLPFP